MCLCAFAALNSQGGHVNRFAPAGRVKPGSRCGAPSLMSAVTLSCLSISLAAIKSVVVAAQVSQGCSAVWHSSKEGQFRYAGRGYAPQQLNVQGRRDL